MNPQKLPNQEKNGDHHEAHEEHEGRNHFFKIRLALRYPIFVLLCLRFFSACANFAPIQMAESMSKYDVTTKRTKATKDSEIITF